MSLAQLAKAFLQGAPFELPDSSTSLYGHGVFEDDDVLENVAVVAPKPLSGLRGDGLLPDHVHYVYARR